MQEEKNENKNNFGSWRENLDKQQSVENNQKSNGTKEPTGTPEADSSQSKPIDGMDRSFSFKERPKIKEEPQKTSSPLKSKIPTKETKRGFPWWLKILLLIILVLVILGAFYFLFFYKSTLKVSVNPPDAQIKINGELKSSTIKLKPGEYTLEIEKESYVTYEEKIQINYFKTSEISVLLKEIPSLISITDLEAMYPAYNKEQDLYLFYVPKEFAFYRVEADKIEAEDKSPTLTTPHYIKNLKDVVWNQDRLIAILKIENNNQLLAGTPFYNPIVNEGTIMTYMYDFGRYDLLHQEATYWGIGISDIKFTPDGNQVAYYFEPGTGEKSLIIANKDRTNLNRALDMRSFTDAKISWANDLKNIIIVNQSKDYATNLIYNFDIIKKELLPITDTGNNIDAVFSPENDLVLYSTYSSDPDFSVYSLLSVMKPDGQDKKELKVRSLLNQVVFTSPEKIVFFEEKTLQDFKLFGQDLNSLERINYLYLGESLKNPEIEEFIATKNSIIISQGLSLYTLTLISDIY